jgi:hypothetical protein
LHTTNRQDQAILLKGLEEADATEDEGNFVRERLANVGLTHGVKVVRRMGRRGARKGGGRFVLVVLDFSAYKFVWDRREALVRRLRIKEIVNFEGVVRGDRKHVFQNGQSKNQR